MKKLKDFYIKSRFNLNARISLYERIADFLDNKFPVEETLDTIMNRYKKNKDYRADVLAEWKRKMANGVKFSDAIKDHVPAEERVLIAAGENGTGGLPQGLRESIRLSKAIAAIKTTIIVGAVYPIFIMLLITAMVAMFSIKIAPVFKAIIPVERWPESGRTLNSASEFLVSHWFMMIVVVFGIGFLVSYSLPRWKTFFRSTADKFPPYSIYRSYQSASFLIALSSMMLAGIGLNESLIKIQEKGSPWLKNHIGIMLRKLRVAGSDYGKALDTGMLSDETAGDIQDYSRLSTFEKAIYSIGEQTLTKTVKTIEYSMAVVRNVAMVVAAGLLFTIFMTSYDLQQDIATNINSKQKQIIKK